MGEIMPTTNARKRKTGGNENKKQNTKSNDKNLKVPSSNDKNRRERSDSINSVSSTTSTASTRRVFPHEPRQRESVLTQLMDKDEEEIDVVQTNDFLGFVNLAFVILIASTLQLTIKQYLKHGFLVDLEPVELLAPEMGQVVFLCFGVVFYSYIGLAIQKLRIGSRFPELLTDVLHLIHITGFIIPLYAITPLELSPGNPNKTKGKNT